MFEKFRKEEVVATIKDKKYSTKEEMATVHKELGLSREDLKDEKKKIEPKKDVSNLTASERLESMKDSRKKETQQKAKKIKINPLGSKHNISTHIPSSQVRTTKQPLGNIPPSPVVRSFKRLNIIKAGRVEYAPTIKGKIEKEGLASVQAQISKNALHIINEYIDQIEDDLPINKNAINEFIESKKDYYYTLLTSDESNFAQNAREFILYVNDKLQLSSVKEIDEILQLLEMVAKLSPEANNESLEEEVESEAESQKKYN